MICHADSVRLKQAVEMFRRFGCRTPPNEKIANALSVAVKDSPRARPMKEFASAFKVMHESSPALRDFSPRGVGNPQTSSIDAISPRGS